MSELLLRNWHPSDYGWRADGVVETEDRKIQVTVRRPHDIDEQTDLTYVMANGWTAGKNSMRTPAIAATEFGHAAITLEYTNIGTADALAQNVKDVAAVIDANPEEKNKDNIGKRRATMGLSMGGAVVTMALEEVTSPVAIADIVASGKYITQDFYSTTEVLKRLAAESGEIFEISRSPLQAIAIGLASASNCVRRPRAVLGELNELLDGNVHDNLRRVKARPNAPYMRFLYMLNDKLLPEYAQLKSVQDEKLPFDDIRSYPGGHGRLAYDISLPREILALDAAELAKPKRTPLTFSF